MDAAEIPVLGHLASTLPWWSRRGEVIATAGLAHLLNRPALGAGFIDRVCALTNQDLPRELKWIPEIPQATGRRADIDGVLPPDDDLPIVRIEAKIGAPLGEDQIEAYARDQNAQLSDGGPSALVLVVPAPRLGSHEEAISSALFPSATRLVILTWDALFAVLATGNADPAESDVLQLQAMCRALSALEVTPFAIADREEGWRSRRSDLLDLATRATRALGVERLKPISDEPDGYRRRYIGQFGTTNVSLGAADPFDEAPETALLARFHRGTAGFEALRRRFEDGEWPGAWFERHGHIWIPLEVPLERDADAVIDRIREQMLAITEFGGVSP